jgi:RND family efflux transporter MFP subunit
MEQALPKEHKDGGTQVDRPEADPQIDAGKKSGNRARADKTPDLNPPGNAETHQQTDRERNANEQKENNDTKPTGIEGGAGQAESKEPPRDRKFLPANVGTAKAGPFSPLVYVVPGIVVASLLGWGAWSHWHVNSQAAATQQQTATFQPTLTVAAAKLEDGPVTLTLPGATAPFDQAKIFARATGYVAERRVDIGSKVRTGDLLVRIAARDLDAQLAQAAAQLVQMQAALTQALATVDQSQANVQLGTVTNARTSTLAGQGWDTLQHADNTRLTLSSQSATLANSQAGVKVAEANIKAQAAVVQRLQELVNYELVTAPFDGVITSRAVDTGDLLTADSGVGIPIFTVQRQDLLRIEIQVPQSSAVGLRDGLAAKVRVPELPGRTFDGGVARSSVALNPGSRTVLTEVDVANPDGKLRPGLYVDVDLAVPRIAHAVIIPAEAIIFNGQGLRVAVVKNGAAHLVDVSIYRDFGTTVELRSGLQGGERVALSPPSDLKDGQKVKVKPPAQPQSGG